ncbi:MAG: hypothetical protein IJO10_09715 [Clostridia bacterium]|nr:hypothetical protein [Clostridia bacterium]
MKQEHESDLTMGDGPEQCTGSCWLYWNTRIRSLQKAIAALEEWIKTVTIPCFLLIAPFPLKTFLFQMDKYGTFFTNKE